MAAVEQTGPAPHPGSGARPLGGARPADTAARQSVGELLASASQDLSALVRDEVALAKAEVRQDVKRAVAGSGSIAVAGLLGFFALMMLSVAAAFGLRALGITTGWAFCIVGAVYLLVAGVLALVALRSFRRIRPPRRTIDSTRRTVTALKSFRPRPAERTARGR
ncbi:phage holin family protein [Allostreptomyces psammosilenae]|uniref:Phage holin family protein n=1 Tax=Allostreptomyces psammosilenae TaxID=1892865 RepID=A0A852ZTE6_9ACTN|nr:phage holin family protein [Allostreptomyces psammosilenae]NYI05609.1 hypothetical protein [Allostreptomyces psammosilenae]